MVKGLPVGTKVLFGGNEIELYEDGSAHLTSTKGLAGSTLKVNMGLKVLVEKAMVPWDYAINSCTLNPATPAGHRQEERRDPCRQRCGYRRAQ